MRQRFHILSLRFVCLAACLALAACQSGPPVSVSQDIDVPPLPNSTAYRVLPDASELRLLVYRDGPLARFGHNHVVSGPIRGELRVGDTTADSGFRLTVDVVELRVDDAAARAEEGEAFAASVDEKSRAGTRENMLGEKLLDADKWPEIRIESIALEGPRWNPSVRAKVTLRGVARELAFPAAVFVDGERLVVIARFTIRQSDFGIEPFSALAGGLRVADSIEARVRLVAGRQ